MKDKDQENRLDGMLLDRLVDGELSDAEYREVLQGLDSQPEGWRRCALAFLEAQAWGREFRVVRCEKGDQPAETWPRRRGSWFYFSALGIACAASFLMAFGVAMQWLGPAENQPPVQELAAQPAQTTVDPDSTDPNSTDPDSTSATNPSIRYANRSSSPRQMEAGNSAGSPLGHYQLVVENGSGAPQTVEMPVFAADDPRADLLLDEYATMPHEIIRALEKSGHVVQSRRNWIPMRGHSGAPLYVPVDELQVTPVSSRSFQ